MNTDIEAVQGPTDKVQNQQNQLKCHPICTRLKYIFILFERKKSCRLSAFSFLLRGTQNRQRRKGVRADETIFVSVEIHLCAGFRQRRKVQHKLAKWQHAS